jgi:hypothetical protein
MVQLPLAVAVVVLRQPLRQLVKQVGWAVPAVAEQEQAAQPMDLALLVTGETQSYRSQPGKPQA